MQRRATSKRRTKDTDTESDMEDKEAQPVPEVEVTATALENPPDRPAQTEDKTPESVDMDGIMKFLSRMEEKNDKNIETVNKNIEALIIT